MLVSVDKFCVSINYALICFQYYYYLLLQLMPSVYADIKQDLEVKDDRLLLKHSPFCGVLVKYEDETRHERNYTNGKLHGLQKSYYKNGQLSAITLYTNGEPNGRKIEYFDCGSKKLNANYTDGELDGISEEWSPDGVMITRKTYYKGKLIAIKSN